MRVLVLLGLVAAAHGAAAPAAPPTAVRGTVAVKGIRSSADVVVTLEASGLPLSPPAEPFKIDQKGFRFLNNDNEPHNVYSPEGRYNLGTWPTGDTKDYTFKKPGIYTQLCNVHPDMLAYVVVVDTPYFAVTDASGAFLIRNVPPGKYRLVAWHEKKDGLERDVEVAAGAPLKLDLVIEK